MPFSDKRAQEIADSVEVWGREATAKKMGITRSSIQRALHHVRKKHDITPGCITVKTPTQLPLPEEGEIKRYIFTAAQNNTKVNTEVLDNLKALAEYYDAELHVSPFTYVRTGFGSNKTAESVKGKGNGSLGKVEISYDPLIDEYKSNEPLQIGDDLVWCGEMNISPTAVNPLSGMDSYTQQASSIFPHTKIALRCVATMKREKAKFMYTTGCITRRNYIPQKTGLKASFHHTYGGLLVEVDSDGVWFARQLNADNNHCIYDLEVVAENGVVYENTDGFASYSPGDVHAASLCPGNKEAIWGPGESVVEVMRPDYVTLHDLVDFRARNHHDTRDPHKNFKKYIDGDDSVEAEMREIVELLDYMSRDFCQLVVVDSNHDQAATRWLKEADYKTDPTNALFYLRCTLAIYEAIDSGDSDFHLVEWALKYLGARDTIKFLRPDESFKVCGIQMGQHGDVGANGSRGSAINLKKLSEKITVGHYHTANITDGVYASGMNGVLDQGYNRGASSWSASDVGAYPNGKRVIITKQQTDTGVAWRL